MALPIVATNSDLSNLTLHQGIIMRVEMELINNPNASWSNDYDFVYSGETSGGTAVPPNWDVIASDWLAFYQHMTLTSTRIVQTTFSTWTKDQHPYNPLTFKTVKYPSSTFGTRLATGDIAPLDQALRCSRDVPYGLNGSTLYRGLLEELDVVATSGLVRLNDPPGFVTILNAALAALGAGTGGGVGPHTYFRPDFGGGGTTFIDNPWGIYLALISKAKHNPGAYQYLTNFTVLDATTAKLTKRRRKKAATPPTP